MGHTLQPKDVAEQGISSMLRGGEASENLLDARTPSGKDAGVRTPVTSTKRGCDGLSPRQVRVRMRQKIAEKCCEVQHLAPKWRMPGEYRRAKQSAERAFFCPGETPGFAHTKRARHAD